MRNNLSRKTDMEALKRDVESYQYERVKRFGVCQASERQGIVTIESES